MDDDHLTTTEATVWRGERIDFFEAILLVRAKKYDCLQRALKLDPSLVLYKDALGETLLMKSIKISENTDIIKLLLDQGSNIEEKDNRHFTALSAAIYAGEKENVEFLLSHGADVNASDNRLRGKPLSLALTIDNESIVDTLREYKVDLKLREDIRFSFLRYSIKKYDIDLLKELLELDLYLNHINDRDKFGRSLLICALQLHYHGVDEADRAYNIVLILLAKKATIELKDYLGRDAFFVAAQFGHVKVVDHFIKLGYKLESSNFINEYKTDHPNVIFAAIKYSVGTFPYDELILKLIDIAPENILYDTDRDGNTLLHLAAEFENEMVYQKLLDKSKDSKHSSFTAENAYKKVNRSKHRYDLKPGQNYLKILIMLSAYQFVKQALQSGVKIYFDHIVSAIEMFDSNLPDVKEIMLFREKIYQTFEVLFRFDSFFEKTMQNWMIKVALTNAIFLEKYKVVYFLSCVYMSNKKFIELLNFIPTSLKMDEFLKKNLKFPIVPNQVRRDNFREFLNKKFMAIPYYTAMEFFVEYIQWKVDTDYKDFAKYNTALERAISFKQIDIGTILIQQGHKIIANQKLEELIEAHLSRDFNKLYKESKGGGLLTLEQTARIAVRKDLESFHKAWSYDILRPILQFKSKMYSIDLYDPSLIKSLRDAFSTKNYSFVTIFLNETEMHGSNFLNYWFAYHETNLGDFFRDIYLIDENVRFSNPLLSAIKDDNLEELKNLIEVENVNVNDFYGEFFNAFHYAIILGKRQVLEFLEKYGNEKCSMKLSPEISYEKVEQIFGVSKCDGDDSHLLEMSRVHDVMDTPSTSSKRPT